MVVFMKQNSLFACIVLVGALLLTGCEGPEGPAGQDGIGIPGPKGDKGEKGDAGTANVIYSEWKAITTNLWTSTNINGVVKFYHDIAAPALDQSVVDRGQVLVYVKLSQDNAQVRALPYTIVSNLTQIRLEYSFSDKNIRIWSVGGSLSPPDGEYRYVIIPGSQQGRLHYSDLTYEAAVALFGITDY